MFINFDTVNVLKSIGIDYFSHSRKNLTNMNESEFDKLHNQWVSYIDSNSGGADVRCDIVHIGKILKGDRSRLKIAVYHEFDRMGTLILFPTNKIDEAITTMHTEAGYGELTCCE